MTSKPTPAQCRVVRAADPATGLLRGSRATLDALVRQGLAVRHPRPPHRCYLTADGAALRARLLAPPRPPAPRAPTGRARPTEAPGTFTAHTGLEDAAGEEPQRARQVHSAWLGLVELRRVTGGTVDLPCPWERAHLASAAALALEAAGCRPAAVEPGTGRLSHDGYQVTDTAQPEAVRVAWVRAEPASQGDGLGRCADALTGAGWQVTEHRDPGRAGSFLLASPRRV